MKTLDLGYTLQACPQCWQNFIDARCGYNRRLEVAVDDAVDPDSEPARRIQWELNKYRGRFHYHNDRDLPYVEFDTPQDLTWFVMRWS